jgi:hypothetical protein
MQIPYTLLDLLIFGKQTSQLLQPLTIVVLVVYIFHMLLEIYIF